MTVGHEPRPSSCTRSREWASLRLDGELSMLERRMLDRHLARCPECDAFAAQVATVAGLMRASVPEAPARPVDVTLVRRPGRIRATRVVLRLGAAVAVVVTAVAAGAALPIGNGESVGPGRLLVIAPDAAGIGNEAELLRKERAALPSQADDVARGFREVL